MNVLIARSSAVFADSTEMSQAASALRLALSQRGHQVDTLHLPFSWSDESSILEQVLALQCFDVRRTDAGTTVDRLIALDFPSSLLNHPSKVSWVLDEPPPWLAPHSLLGELIGTLCHAPAPQGMGVVVAGSARTAARLRFLTGRAVPVIYVPLPEESPPGSLGGEFILVLGELEEPVRQDVLLGLLSRKGSQIRLIWLLSGKERRARLQERIVRSGLGHRVSCRLSGHDDGILELSVRSRGIVDLRAGCRLAWSALAGLRSQRMVLTAVDGGANTELIDHDLTGWLVDAERGEVDRPLRRLWSGNPAFAHPDSMRQAGLWSWARIEQWLSDPLEAGQLDSGVAGA